MNLSLQNFVSASALTHAHESYEYYMARQTAGGQVGPSNYNELVLEEDVAGADHQ